MVIKKVMNMLKRMVRDWFLGQMTWQIQTQDVINVVKDERGQSKVFLGKEELSLTDLRQLKIEAEALQRFRLWHIMQETVKQKAVEKGMLHSTDWESVLSGKLMLHNLGLLQSIVDLVEKLRDPETLVVK